MSIENQKYSGVKYERRKMEERKKEQCRAEGGKKGGELQSVKRE